MNNGVGGCTGAHTNAFECPWSGGVAQNTCCMRTGSTYAQIRTSLYSCLQSMWDEGRGQPDNASQTSANGHWFNMRDAQNTHAHCGFAFGASNQVWMNQDFTRARPTSVPLTCSCAGKPVGEPDGCGGTCILAD